MVAIGANGISIDVDDTGGRDSAALVLIRGLGTQRILWPPPLVDGLVDRGFRVVCFDNRDVGLSEKIDGSGPEVAAAVAAMLRGEPVEPYYTLDDMALDTIAVLDACEIEAAHVVGISMGGMIAQLLAANHAPRVRSLTSIMSSSGNPALPPPTPEAMEALLSQPADPTDRGSVVAHSIRTQKAIGGRGYPASDAELRDRAERSFDRCHHPAGPMRQLMAVFSSGSRVELLKRIAVPSLVIHGDDDPLVPLEAGRDTARQIPGAELHTIPGMGHDLAPGLVEILVEAIAQHVDESERAQPA